MLATIGLGGDGDEVDAIGRIERRFGVAFDIERSERFVAVGDVWVALIEELQLDEAEAGSIWADFVAALGEETLTEKEFGEVSRETLLIDGIPPAVVIGRWIRRRLRG